MNCVQCNKEFKRPQDLKTHNTKYHKIEVVVQQPIIEESQIQEEQVFDSKIITDYIIDTLISQTTQNSEKTFFDSEFTEDGLNCETYDSFIEEDAIYMIKSKRPNMVTIQTQTEEFEIKAIVHEQLLKTNGIFMESEKRYLKELPSICDDIRMFNGKLQAVIDNIAYDISNIQLFNQYERIEVDYDNRVKPMPQIMEFTRRSYNQYRPDDIKHPSYLNMRTDRQGNQFPALIAKLYNENNVICKLKPLVYAYFDIETFDTDLSYQGVPLASRQTSHISMISLIVDQTAILFHLDIYRFSVEQAQLTILNHCGQTYDIQTQISENEHEMVLQFIMQLKALSMTNTVILSGFNSSNDAKGLNIMGYDGSFILRNLKSTVKIEKRRCQGSGEFPSQLVQIAILPNVYFVDMMLLFNENTKTQKKEIQGMSLNAYLRFYKVPVKMDGNHREQRPVQINGGDISVYGAYCLYDSICLQLVQSKHHVIAQRLSYCDKFGLPLSMCLYATTVNMLTCHLQQQFYKQDYMFTYSKIGEFNEVRTKQGAMTQQCPEEHRYVSLPYVHIFDFTSQYPNMGIQKNISPETFSLEYVEGYHRVQLNYQKDQPADFPEDQKIYAYFNNTKPGIVSEFQRVIFDERSETRKLQKTRDIDQTMWLTLEIKQLALKEMINSMYGAQNDSRSPLYRYQCGSAITGGSRQLLDETIRIAEELYKTKRLFADTDSLALQYSGEDVNTIHQEIQARLSKNNPRMVLEFEKSYRYVMYPENLKSYINIDENDQLTIKGVPFNRYTLQYRSEIDVVFKAILLNQTETTPQQMCYEYQNQIKNKLKQLVYNKDINALQAYVHIRKYNKLVTKTGQQTLTGYLVDMYPTVQELNTIPFNTHFKKAFCHIPIELITTENIGKLRINDLAADLCKPLKTFFKIDVPKSEKYNGKADPGVIVVRIQTTSCFCKKQNIEKSELVSLIQKTGSNTVYHEIMVNEVNKCYFDIESTKIMISAYKLTYTIQEVLQNYNVRIHIGEGNKPGKMSYHIVADVKMNRQVNKHIAQLINAKLGDICDLAVYKPNASFRLPLCVKIDKDNQIENRKIKPISGSTLFDFLVSDCVDELPDYCDFISYSNKCPISDAQQFGFNIKSTSVIQILKDLKITAQMVRGNQIDIKTKPYTCPGCQEVHQSNNMLLVGDRIKCYPIEQCQGLLIEAKTKREPKVQPLEDPYYSATYKVQYDLEQAHHTFIKSAMGTGKTEQLLQLIDDKLKTIVVISFRRTFADEFSKKMSFTNYQAIGCSDIKLSENPRICIQYESLHKLDMNCDIDLVVCDEIESILSQITAFDKRENNQNSLTLIDLLRNKSLIMDALLQQSTIDLIQHLTGVDNTTTYENTYQMQKQRIMYIDNKPTDTGILTQIRDDLLNGKRVSVNCCSKKLAQVIRNMALQLNKQVALYDGDNNTVLEQFGKTQTMGSHKLEQLQNPNLYWKQIDILIYTATISAGVSFTEKHFNLQYGILKNKSSDVIAFTQGNHRVRDLSDNIHKIFIFPLHHDNYLNNPLKVSSKSNSFNARSVYTRNNQIQQLNIYLQARSNTLRINAKMLFKLWSTQSGYQIIEDTKLEESQQINDMPILEQIQPLEQQDFQFTEQEFNELPRLLKANDFSLTHCDVHMNTKISIVFIAGIYNLDYHQTMTLRSDLEKWSIMTSSKCIQSRLRKNLQKLALIRTRQQEFNESTFTAIKQELLDYHNQQLQYQSLITTNLNITTDFQKLKYIESFIIGIETYKKVQDLLQQPIEFEAYLNTLSNKRTGAIKMIKTLLEPLDYDLKSTKYETKTMVGGKRISTYTYDYKLQQIDIPSEYQEFLI